jgi:hypothetical protein
MEDDLNKVKEILKDIRLILFVIWLSSMSIIGILLQI